MRPAIYAPDAALYLRIEFNPVGGVQPILGYALRRADPRFSAVFTPEEPNIRSRNEPSIGIERVEMVAVSGGDVQTGADPPASRFSRIHGDPILAPVRGQHGAAQIRAVRQIRVLVRDSKGERIFAPIRSKSVGNPGIVNIGGRFSLRIAVFLPHQLPRLSGVRGLGDSQPLDSAKIQLRIRQIGGLWCAQASCNGSHLSSGST